MAREENFFDDLARGLADGTLTRGKAIRLMGAAVVGGALGSLGIREASADTPGCKRNGKACKKNTQCCSGKCSGGVCAPACGSNGESCATGTDCCSGNCKDSVCVESCIPPYAIPCDPSNPESCGGGRLGSCFCERATEGGGYCQTDGSSTFCSSSCDCPAGQFCQATGDGGRCAIAGTVCGA